MPGHQNTQTMATLRLFAGIREAAGVKSLTVEASTVAEVIDAASQEFGPDFIEQVQTCRIWLNGEPAQLSAIVTDSDEVALLPPVSGG